MYMYRCCVFGLPASAALCFHATGIRCVLQFDAFSIACGNGQLETAQAMLTSGCRTQDLDYIYPDCGQTALGLAAANGHLAVVQWLHSLGARFYSVDAVKVSVP